ncbi:cyclin domain-containing protein [Pilobolus umbonatus]|nr:cyclin domain-containing protein [Pilobolus umbonatus]
MKINDLSTVFPKLIFKSSPEPFLSYMVSHISDLVPCSKKRKHYQHMLLPKLDIFIMSIYQDCHLTPAVLVIGLIYLKRVRRNLPRESHGDYDTSYKLFLAAVIIATKYIEDFVSNAVSIYKVVSPLYSSKELNEMERSFLGILQFNLHVDLGEIYKFISEHQESLELQFLNNL